ncbi:ATP-binding protein [Methyloferula stellata]|uniref:ATP-binding protein n=1 Tax=Methyloferula stellata TaxID=876270 RepID=UPI00038024C8|nr:ATP-binding protein [Methyloferula stellata]
MAEVDITSRQAGRSAPQRPSESRGLDAKPGLFARMRNHLARRPDSEHETAFNRFALCACALLYLIGASFFGDAEAHRTLAELAVNFAIFNFFAVVIFILILRDSGVSPLRRFVSICVDAGCVSYLIHMGGAATALFYPLLLWIIFGNGFRFGVRYLAIAAAVATFTFSAVVITTPFWRDNISLSLGLIVGQIVLPAYVSILIRKLSEAKRQAEEANRAKSLFLASVSHELRTPLNAIIGLSDLLSDMTTDEEQGDMSRTIATAGRSLLALITSILDFSQKEVTKSPEREEEVDLFSLLASTRDMLAVQANARGLWLTLHITPRVPQFVTSDSRGLEQILVNLTGNALKFTQAGHVTIFADAIEMAPGRVKLRIEVSDTGIGIAPEAQARIFESFTQADETIIDRFGGSGLGLAIVKQLVEAKGGKVGVESIVGAGSTFWLEFECLAGTAKPLALPSQMLPWLLLSEDRAIGPLIEQQGVTVEQVSTMADLAKTMQAPEWTRAHHRPVIILDQRAFGANLEEIARRLRGSDPARGPMLIALKENESVDIQSRELYLTTLPRPLDAASIMNMWQHVSWSKRKSMARRAVAHMAYRPLSILVAEDNKTNQKVIAKILERAGHCVHLVDNGEVALEAMIDKSFDIALIDLNMPVLNGIEMTKLYRFVAAGRAHLPIIALTADVTAETKVRCTEAGMDDCLTKPIEPAHLLNVLNSFAGGWPPEEADLSGIETKPVQVADANRETAAVDDEPIIDTDKLTYLQKLGGKEFVSDLLDQYVSDAARMLRELSNAVAEENLPKFQDSIHALRSCSANVGAKAIYNLCLSWREVDAYDLALRGEDHMKVLEAEFAKARSAMDLYEEDGTAPAVKPFHPQGAGE